MDSSIRPPYTPHVLYVRAPSGTLLEVDSPPVYQPKLAVNNAYTVARALARQADSVSVACGPAPGADIELVDPLDLTVEVWRAVPADYPGAVNGCALLLEVPVRPATQAIDLEDAAGRVRASEPDRS